MRATCNCSAGSCAPKFTPAGRACPPSQPAACQPSRLPCPPSSSAATSHEWTRIADWGANLPAFTNVFSTFGPQPLLRIVGASQDSLKAVPPPETWKALAQLHNATGAWGARGWVHRGERKGYSVWEHLLGIASQEGPQPGTWQASQRH